MGLSQWSQFDAAPRDQPSNKCSTLARAVAPEDIARGDFVAILHEIVEVPSFFWCFDQWRMPYDQPVRIRFTARDEAVPYRVKSICLPFLLVKHPAGLKGTLDLRKCQLARLDRKYAASAWKAYKKRRLNSKCGR